MHGAGASDAETQPRELPIRILVLATVSALETCGTRLAADIPLGGQAR
jgi:hypothetical protein